MEQNSYFVGLSRHDPILDAIRSTTGPLLLRVYSAFYFGAAIVIFAAIYRYFYKPTTAMRNLWSAPRRPPVAIAQTS
ncbi:hypothetical protein CIW50_22755 [Tardiphaga sp. P9-11]|nr:hypothetical protein CIW50_22755 [Tardiphaga sp. P9-11]